LGDGFGNAGAVPIRERRTCRTVEPTRAHCQHEQELLGQRGDGEFFLNLTMERVWHSDYANYDEAKRDIKDYIVGFYNRLHSTLDYRSPNVHEAGFQKQPA
jgi:hypothetical protein